MPNLMNQFQWTIYSKNKPELHAALCKLKKQSVKMSAVLGEIVEAGLRKDRPQLFEPDPPAVPVSQAAAKPSTLPNTNRTRK